MARSAKGHQDELEDDEEEEEFLTANTSTSLNKGLSLSSLSLSLSLVWLCNTRQGLSIDSLMGVSKFLSFYLFDSILQFNFQF